MGHKYVYSTGASDYLAYNEIKRIYQIFFTNCILFPESEKFPQRFSFREETEHYRLNDLSEIIFYELPKLEHRVQKMISRTALIKKDISKVINDNQPISSLSDEEKWCIFMRYRHEKRASKLIEKLYREEEGIMRAENAVNEIDRDFLESVRWVAEMKNRMDRAQAISNASKKAMEKAKLEIASKMIEKGIPIPQIVELTGISPDKIKRL